MMTISKDNNLVTLINVFTVEPANQQRLVDLINLVTESEIRHAPGFIAANLHRSLDGSKVAVYSQWRSVQDYEAMRKNPASRSRLEQAVAIAKFDPGIYEVVATHAAA
jgi:quinol monooxygenase YgiN